MNWGIDEEEAVDFVAMMTLMGVLDSSWGSSLLLNSLVHGQVYQGVLNQLGPVCHDDPSPRLLRWDSLLVYISDMFSAEAIWKTSSRWTFEDSLSLRLGISLRRRCINGLKLVAVLSSEEMMHVESPKHEIEPKPPLYSDAVLERSLVKEEVQTALI